MVHSRDGRHWQRCEDRQAVIANGPYGYDAGCILGVANLPVIHGDEMWLYYTAITTTHGGALPEKKIAIARAAWRLDGWVSLDAAEEGSVETVPVRTEGGTLVLNADAGQGRLRVEVLNEQGEPLPGYSRQECLPLEGDQLHHSVRWQTHNTLPADQPVRFRFLLERCRLYSFRQET